MSVNPDVKTHWQTQQCKFDVPASHFHVFFGYKERSSVQVRLDKDGRTYLSHCDDAKPIGEDRLQSVTIEFDLFQKKFREFIRHLQAITNEP